MIGLKKFFSKRSFSMRLLLGFVGLIFLTTLLAGVPAFWLARSQLERQAWLQVDSAQRATSSLLEAEEIRLSSQLVLLSERPTLKALIQAETGSELQLYLQDFRRQSGLDLLFLCSADNRLIAGSDHDDDCPSNTLRGFVVIKGQPMLLSQELIIENGSVQTLARAVGAIELGETFLDRLAAATGTRQSVLDAAGIRLSSNFTDPGSRLQFDPGSASDSTVRRALTEKESVYYAAYIALHQGAGSETMLLEVALQVNDLVATEQRAFIILAGSTAGVALFGSLLSLWFLRQVNAPLQRLTTAAENISRGDLLAAIPLFSSPEEIRTLATALHRSQASMLEALREREEVGERLNVLLQSVVEGVVTYDEDGQISFWSEGAHQIMGWTTSEAIGRHVNGLFPMVEGNQDLFLDLIPPSGLKRQLNVFTSSKRPVTLALTSSPLVPPGGDTVQIALVFRDVTEEEALRSLRSYFLANISHEFRTPLSTLIASMELLLDEREELTAAEVRQLLRPTHISLLSLQTLIDNLLESSSIEGGQFRLRRHPFDFLQAIENATRITRPLLERREQVMTVDTPPGLSPVEGDSTRLTQALVNLIFNASKYSPIGGPITLRLALSENHLRVEVSDRGPGIPPEERTNLFRRFVRLDTGDREQYGIGLGLFVVKTIVDAHGGQVGIDSRTGGGSRFWFEIPLRREVAPA